MADKTKELRQSEPTGESPVLEPCTSAHDAEASRPGKEEDSCDEGLR